MKSFIKEIFSGSAARLKTLSAVLTLLCLSLYINAQNTIASTANSKISGFLIDNDGQPMAFGLISLCRVTGGIVSREILTDERGLYIFNQVPAGSYVIRAADLGFFEETSGKLWVATNGSNIINMPDLKMEKNIGRFKYWQTNWYKPVINQSESNQNEIGRMRRMEKYWQADWFDNMP